MGREGGRGLDEVVICMYGMVRQVTLAFTEARPFDWFEMQYAVCSIC